MKIPLPLDTTDADMTSPGCTGLGKNTGAFGKISYQPWYEAAPLAQSASVPVCSTVGVPSPSSPTQKEEKAAAAPQATAGCAHEEETLVKEPAAPVAA